MPAKSTTGKSTKTSAAAPRRRSASPRRSTKQRRPEHSQIAERAYFIHLEEGCSDQVTNWLRAERELTTA